MATITTRIRRTFVWFLSECGVTGLWAFLDTAFVTRNAKWFVLASTAGLIGVWFWDQIREFLDWKRGKLAVKASDNLKVKLVPEAIEGDHLHYHFTVENRGLRGVEILEDRTSMPDFIGIAGRQGPRFIAPSGELDINAMPVNFLMKKRSVRLELVYRASGEQVTNSLYYRFVVPSSNFPMGVSWNPVEHGANTEHVGHDITDTVAGVLASLGVKASFDSSKPN